MVLNQLMRCVSHVTVNGLCMSAAWSDSFVSHAERALNLRTIDVVQRYLDATDTWYRKHHCTAITYAPVACTVSRYFRDMNGWVPTPPPPLPSKIRRL